MTAFKQRDRIEVGILGATGMVGQEFVARLDSHPWFKVVWLAASERSEGRRYSEAAHWRLPVDQPLRVADLFVNSISPDGAPRVVFSGLDSSVAGEVERAFAQAGHIVVSNAKNFRMDDDVPLVVPEVNPDHLDLLTHQATRRGWPGRIVTNPNCSTIVLVMALAPLRKFGLRSVNVTTLQAVSGAGYPGVSSFDIVGNVIPFISGEEEKMETETKKIFGSLQSDVVVPHPVTVSAHTTRVGVTNGHTEMISVGFEDAPPESELLKAFKEFSGRPQEEDLPGAPFHAVEYFDEADRPQPRLDVDRGKGMTVSVGRLRRCSVLDYKFVALGHNTVRGAAGAAVLNAELMMIDGILD